MSNNEFVAKAIDAVVDYYNSYLGIYINTIIGKDDVYVVWLCKALQNNKALLSTTIPDGMYYEIAYNGDTNEAYLDVYKKDDNIVMPNF